MGRELPVAVRVAFYAWLLVALALADLLTDRALVTLAVLGGFLLIVLPLCVRFFGGPGSRARRRAAEPSWASQRS